MPRGSKRLPETPFYRDLGRKLRVARSASGRNQGDVAAHLDVTFQQIQKYENGTNRIPVDRLVRLAAYLEVPLLELIDPGDDGSGFKSLAARLGAKEFHSLMEAWGTIKDRRMRAGLLDLVRRMAELKC